MMQMKWWVALGVAGLMGLWMAPAVVSFDCDCGKGDKDELLVVDDDHEGDDEHEGELFADEHEDGEDEEEGEDHALFVDDHEDEDEGDDEHLANDDHEDGEEGDEDEGELVAPGAVELALS